MTSVAGLQLRLADVGAHVARWRRRLRGAALLRAVLAGAGTGLFAGAVARFATPSSVVALSVGLVSGLAVAGALWWRSHAARLTPEGAALWLEERDPSLRYALVTAAEGDHAPQTQAALARALERTTWERPARAALQQAMAWPTAMLLAGATAFALVPAGAAGRGGHGTRTRDDHRVAAPPALGSVSVTLTPPRYTALPAQRSESPPLVRAYPGSALELRGGGPAEATTITLDARSLATQGSDADWRARTTTGDRRALIRVERIGGESRLVALEPLVDSAPVVTLRAPARDTVFRQPTGTVALAADVHDDLGLASATFEYIVSSGEGERFTFRSGTLGALANGATTDGALAGTLSLQSLGLGPGDVVHLRAVARDRNNISGPGVGSSESRTIRIARADEYDSVAVEQAPPPDVDKAVLSQRMLINMTEALLKRAPKLAAAEVVAESRRIGRDQARLRKQVSDVIFARLGDAPDGEHFHGDGHNHAEGEAVGDGKLTPEQLLRAAERATQTAGQVTDFEHDETPVVAINRPMLEAYNAMWDAGRALDGGEPSRALKPMYAALAAIQRARAAERLYLRGAPPRVVVDIARVRLAGKDTGAPGARTPRAPTDEARRPLIARFSRAIDLLARDAAAGIDSLIVLRLAVAGDDAVAAAALEGAIGDLRASRDATAALLRARRALGELRVVGDSLSAWGDLR